MIVVCLHFKNKVETKKGQQHHNNQLKYFLTEFWEFVFWIAQKYLKELHFFLSEDTIKIISIFAIPRLWGPVLVSFMQQSFHWCHMGSPGLRVKDGIPAG